MARDGQGYPRRRRDMMMIFVKFRMLLVDFWKNFKTRYSVNYSHFDQSLLNRRVLLIKMQTINTDRFYIRKSIFPFCLQLTFNYFKWFNSFDSSWHYLSIQFKNKISKQIFKFCNMFKNVMSKYFKSLSMYLYKNNDLTSWAPLVV